MATGSGKADKALKEKQNKLTLMGKVLMRDKHDKSNKKDRETKATSGDLETVAKEERGKSKTSLMDKVLMRDKNDKHSRKERDSKGTSRDLDTMSLDGDVVAKQQKSSIIDRVFMRDRRDRMSKRDRNSKASSGDVTKATREAAEETDSVTGLLSDNVRMRHDGTTAYSRRERDARASSAPCAADLDTYRSTSMGDLRDLRYGGDLPLRRGLDRSNSKRENRLSSSSVVKWFKHITEAAESYKGKEKPAHRRSVRKAGSSGSVNENSAGGAGETVQEGDERIQEEEEGEDRTRKDSKEERMGGLLERHASSSVDSVENLEQAEVLHINQSADLIQPSEVCVSDTMVMVEEAQPVRNNQELLVEKDQLITRAIEEKQNLVAQILNVPLQDFQHVAEIATEDEGEKGARELLLAAIYQATQLTSLLNASLNAATSASTVTMLSHSSHSNGAQEQQQPVVQEPPTQVTESPEDRLHADSTGNDVTSPAVASGSDALTVKLPCQQVNTVTSRLNQHLNQLLDVINRREEETERLQQQLKMTSEQLTRLQGASPLNHSTSQPTSRPDSFMSSASETGDTGSAEGVPIPVHTEHNSLLHTSSESPKLTPIVVSHVVTSEVTVEKLASLTINDPIETVLTSTPTTVTSPSGDVDAAAESDASDNSAGSEDDAVTSPRTEGEYDVTHTEETPQLV